MSLLHIQKRSIPTIFGDDLNVLIADTTINGNLDIQGSVNGTHSQGQNTNNDWTGTNDFSVLRPTSIIDTPTLLEDGVNSAALAELITAAGIINQGDDFTGTNTFSQNVYDALTTFPVGGNDAVVAKYITDTWTAKQSSYLTLNNAWTGTNTFNILPLVQEPINGTNIATLNYVTTQTALVAVTDATSTTSNVNIVDDNWAGSYLASVQIVGGGGGSTSSVGTCVCSSAGCAGGSGCTASLLVLLGSELGGSGSITPLGTFSISRGGGGSAGNGCGVGSNAGSGGATNFYVTPTIASGFNQTQVNILRANGGNGFGGSCGEAGSPAGGVYSNINPNVIVPFGYLNGRKGGQCLPINPNYASINTLGWGARGATCNGGVGGNAGGYGLTLFNYPVP
jgi:hypothetical protein